MSKIIDTSEHTTTSRLQRKMPLAITVVAVALAVVGGLIYFSSQDKTGDTAKDKSDKPADYNSLVIGIDENNYGDAIGQLDKLAEQAANDKARAGIYVQKAALALKVKAYDDALRYAKSAEQLDPDPSVTAVVAKSAEAKGDKEQAIAYYKKAIAGLNPKTENGQGDIEIYTQAIIKLGGTP